MIASEDVRRVTFDRTMRGYRCEDVDDYLKQVADSMDALAAERDEMQKKLVVLAQRIDQYRADEDTLRTTMLNAQRLGENVIKEAKQKAAEIIRAANIKAENREQHARDEVELAQQKLISIRHEADSFKKSLMDMYRKHIELLSQMPSYPEEIEAAPEPAPEAPLQDLPDLPVEPAPAPKAARRSAKAAKAEPEAEPAAPAEPPEEFEQQQFGEADGTTYYQPEAEAEAPVDTVEFAITEADEDQQELAALDAAPGTAYADGTRFVPGAGLYDAPDAAAQGGELPKGLESFAGIDFES